MPDAFLGWTAPDFQIQPRFPRVNGSSAQRFRAAWWHFLVLFRLSNIAAVVSIGLEHDIRQGRT
jgi:hypothetical protein